MNLKLFDVISLLLLGVHQNTLHYLKEKDAHIRMGIEASKVLIIPNGVNADDYHVCLNRDALNVYGIPEAKYIVCW